MPQKKRALVALLLCALLAPILLSAGCTAQAAGPADACSLFLEHLRSGEYEAAYELLHSSVRYDEAQVQRDIDSAKARREQEIEQAQELGLPVDALRSAELEVTRSKKNISKEEFIESYTNRFDLLQISGFSYAIKSSVEGDAICVYDYVLIYDSALLPEEALEFRMSVRRENNGWTVEWSPALLFPGMEWGDTIRQGSSAARRGEILADGVVYAQTVNAVSVLMFPAEVEDPAQFARQVSALTDLSIDSVLKQLETTKGDFAILKQYYPDSFPETLESQLRQIPGISIDRNNFGTLRNYPQGDMLAHIIGYVGPITPEELLEFTVSKEGNALYNADSRVGKAGLERAYETQLRGTDGTFIFIADEEGLNKQTLYREPAQHGLDLQLTLQAELQDRADKLLQYSLYGEQTAGAVIVMDPTTGLIEAMSSYPSYDLNLFSRGMTPAQWETLSNMPNRPMFNRLTQGRYPPGSIFKPFTAAAALESGAMQPDTVFPEGRGETIEVVQGNRYPSDKTSWLPSDRGEFGPWAGAPIIRVTMRNRSSPPLNMKNGMVDSDNIYFAYAALRTGIEDFTAFTDRLGLNESVPFEVSVNPAQMKNEKSEWRPMLLAESAFGQGEVLVTPLQATSLFSSLANGGTIMQPYIVEGLYRMEGISYIAEETHTPTAWKSGVIQPSSISTIVPMLESVITAGTGRSLNMNNVAGKTGTAQIGNDRSREIVWFAGFRLNHEQPRLVLVMLEIPANDSALSGARFEIARALLK